MAGGLDGWGLAHTLAESGVYARVGRLGLELVKDCSLLTVASYNRRIWPRGSVAATTLEERV